MVRSTVDWRYRVVRYGVLIRETMARKESGLDRRRNAEARKRTIE